ncbi:TetR family transcriptional regulator [Mycobacterium alsense]|uniref:TetR family transcriptional regulator n=1 Tax=Mycobacterium alsense TaxID=324058 RepID=A0AA41XLS1_9MYCO|nr:TetR/AcrR family transcriptional regulator [Mycobacterium alsense]MCV7377943.1 TetR/AcrR family transcriptional regulator [Mycobacterium alsense]OQZ88809.1 TetR family transcriptional regulator [Mycobacterium alsense]
MAQEQGQERLDTKARRAAQAEGTRAALVDAAKRLFVEKGYHHTGTEEVVAEADVGTRGALYHHFADKQALFEAVFIAVEEGLVMEAAKNLADPADGAFNQLRQGLIGFLDASLTPQVQRILLIDGPAVLGWSRWRELESVYGLGAIRAMLERAIEEGDLASGQPVAVLAHVLLAAAEEAAMFIANAPHQQDARDESVQALNALLDGLRPR